MEVNGSSAAGVGVAGPAGDSWKSAPAPDGFEIRLIDEEIGKGVFATRKFVKGETVLTDIPIVTSQFAWNYLYKYKACEFCMRALETAEENVQRLTGRSSVSIEFPECCETTKQFHVFCSECDAQYCSEGCRAKAWAEYHSVLCFHAKTPPENHPIKVLDCYWRQMHYPPETANIMLLVKLLVKLHFDKDRSLHKRLSSFCQGTTTENQVLAHKMLGDEYIDQINQLRMLVSSVVSFSNIKEWLTPEGFLKLFVLIGRNGQGVGTSPFAVWVANFELLEMPAVEKKQILDRIDGLYDEMDKVNGHFLDNEGSALYPIQSWVNHSCMANTDVRFPDKNHKVGLVAIRDIEEGEEITICYLDLGDLERSRYSRNKYLLEHYLFTCNCEKCMAQIDDEDCSSEDDEDMSDEDFEQEELMDGDDELE